jgi:hypothetical protein
MNRVTIAIAKTEKQIEERIACGLATQDKVDTMHKTLDMAFDEYCAFQNLKSLASVSGKLTLEEAQTVYAYLGNTVEHFNAQGIGVKVVLTKIYSELLDWKISQRAA